MCVVCIQYFMITIFISALYYELFAVSNKPFCSGDRCYFRLQTAGILIINFDNKILYTYNTHYYSVWFFFVDIKFNICKEIICLFVCFCIFFNVVI
jgi:hypothetical protein